MEEVFRDVIGYEGKYQVSNCGNVKSLNYGNRGYSKNLTPKKNNKGYLWVELANNGTKKCFLIHRLVCSSFLENPNNLQEVNHKDFNVENNSLDNLEWISKIDNVRHYFNSEKASNVKKGVPRKLFEHIEQIDMFGNVVNTFENVISIKTKYGFNTFSITECCKGNRKTAYGYKWRFA